MPPLEGEDLRRRAEALLGAEVRGLTRIGAGGNNRLYSLHAGDGRRYALKTYLREAADRRDRLGAEFGGLDFLWRHGVRQVPRPVAADAGEGAAIYDWIDGETVAAPSERDIRAVIGFIRALRRVGGEVGALDLPLASEACLSGAEIVRQIDRRRRHLDAVGARDLDAFLQHRLGPARDDLVARARRWLERAGIDFDGEIALGDRVLSPSDFGFHNALRRPDRSLVFLDFEYFGWDDPVKLIADFELHPAMRLAPPLRARFRADALALFEDQPAIAPRLEALLPLFALRWCLIMLNPFLPEGRRRLAYVRSAEEARGVARRRLEDAGRMLDRFALLLEGHDHDSRTASHV